MLFLQELPLTQLTLRQMRAPEAASPHTPAPPCGRAVIRPAGPEVHSLPTLVQCIDLHKLVGMQRKPVQEKLSKRIYTQMN